MSFKPPPGQAIPGLGHARKPWHWPEHYRNALTQTPTHHTASGSVERDDDGKYLGPGDYEAAGKPLPWFSSGKTGTHQLDAILWPSFIGLILVLKWTLIDPESRRRGEGGENVPFQLWRGAKRVIHGGSGAAKAAHQNFQRAKLAKAADLEKNLRTEKRWRKRGYMLASDYD